jgi:hypothetical protein
MMDGPVTYQECMMQEKMEMAKPMLCCVDEDTDCESETPLDDSECCKTLSTSKIVEDEFITFNQELKNRFTSLIVILSNQRMIEDGKRVTSHPSYTYDLSPPSSTDSIFILNSALLI